MRLKYVFQALPALAFAGLVSGQVSAATVQLDFDVNFGEGAVAGDPPWLTAVFDDGGSAGSVTLALTVSGDAGTADINQIYFNLDPLLDSTDLTITRTGGTGPVAGDIDIYTGNNSFQADGDGIYDIYFQLPPPPGNQAKRFSAGETLFFDITGIATLTADDFNFFAEPGGGNGPFLAAAQAIDAVNGDSTWIAAVPIPAAAWLFGSGIGMLLFLRRRRNPVAD